MPRHRQGPKLILRRQPGARAMYYVTWTDENGRSRQITTGTGDLAPAQAILEDFLAQQRRASRTGPGDPAETRISEVLDEYEAEHGGDVASPASLAYAVEPLAFFFAGTTIA